MTAVVPAETSLALAEPERFRWRGIRFERRPVRGREIYRYEPIDFGFYEAWLVQWASGQWGAAFSCGVYAVEWSKEDALESARLREIEQLYYRIGKFEGLSERGHW